MRFVFKVFIRCLMVATIRPDESDLMDSSGRDQMDSRPDEKNGQILAKSDREKSESARATMDQGRHGGGVASWRYCPAADGCWGLLYIQTDRSVRTNTSPWSLCLSAGDLLGGSPRAPLVEDHDAALWSSEKLLNVCCCWLGALTVGWQSFWSAFSSVVRGEMTRRAGESCEQSSALWSNTLDEPDLRCSTKRWPLLVRRGVELYHARVEPATRLHACTGRFERATRSGP